ncbi:MAG TPA: U32 family peptidase, partial [Methanocorpusculum sp.]|nr:U32 family peptidase [Methanocorpusculum sp.]
IIYEGTYEIYDFPVIYKLLRILHEDDLIKTLEQLSDLISGMMVDNVGIAEVIKGIPKYGGFCLNITNAHAAMMFGKTGQQVCLSLELSGNQIRTLMKHLASYHHAPKTEVIVQGKLKVMITRNCIPVIALECPSCNHSWAFKDETGRIFRVRPDTNFCNHILHSSEICLIEHTEALVRSGFSVLSIDARGRSPDYVRRMVSLYKASVVGGNVKELKDQIRDIASGGITAAHYLRGVSTT